jgi:hypothetical protein
MTENYPPHLMFYWLASYSQHFFVLFWHTSITMSVEIKLLPQ